MGIRSQVLQILKIVSIGMLGVMFIGMQYMLYGIFSSLPQYSEIEIYQYLSNRVVKLTDPDTKRFGTGFFVSDSKGAIFIMSNRHVCDRESISKTVFYKNSPIRTVKVLRLSKTTDLCLLEGLPHFSTVALASDIPLPSRIFYYGMPKGFYGAFEQGVAVARQQFRLTTQITQKFTAKDCKDMLNGEVFGLKCDYTVPSVIATTLRVNFGSSGSPVVNEKMELVGVVFAKEKNNYGYIVPIDEVRKFLNEGDGK